MFIQGSAALLMGLLLVLMPYLFPGWMGLSGLTGAGFALDETFQILYRIVVIMGIACVILGSIALLCDVLLTDVPSPVAQRVRTWTRQITRFPGLHRTGVGRHKPTGLGRVTTRE